MKNKPVIAASILAADWTQLGKETLHVLDAGADWIHFDVMDNHYVPNLGFTPQLCQGLKALGVKDPIDVHLQAQPIHNLIHQFAMAGADQITFHPETSQNIDADIQTIQKWGLKAGLAFAPNIPLDRLEHINCHIDLIVIMSVNPGFGGQTFIPHVLNKLKQARIWIDQNNSTTRLAIDGGITLENIQETYWCGADTFMIGSTIFKSNNYATLLQLLRDRIKYTQSE